MKTYLLSLLFLCTFLPSSSGQKIKSFGKSYGSSQIVIDNTPLQGSLDDIRYRIKDVSGDSLLQMGIYHPQTIQFFKGNENTKSGNPKGIWIMATNDGHRWNAVDFFPHGYEFCAVIRSTPNSIIILAQKDNKDRRFEYYWHTPTPRNPSEGWKEVKKKKEKKKKRRK